MYGHLYFYTIFTITNIEICNDSGGGIMNISRSHLDGIIRLYNTTSKDTKTHTKDDLKNGHYADSVTLSSEAKLIDKVVKEALQANDVRAEKVEALKKRIETRTYQVDARLVAEKIIEECLIDKIT
jgi:flagellar biosynthesis anti-sigma factor FlgM